MLGAFIQPWRALAWGLCLVLAAPHGGAHGAHHAVEMVICGGAKTITLWIEREGARDEHGVDCCLIHAAMPPVEAAPPPAPALRSAPRRLTRAGPAPSPCAPSPVARGPPVLS